MTLKRSPSAVVLAAYRAANRGRFALANRFLSERHRAIRLSSATSLKASNRQIRAGLAHIQNPQLRENARQLAETLRAFEDPHYIWKGSTQGRSIRAMRVLREATRGERATVTIALRLGDGRVRIERNRLVRAADAWVIDVIEVLENNEMRTKAARARYRGLRR